MNKLTFGLISEDHISIWFGKPIVELEDINIGQVKLPVARFVSYGAEETGTREAFALK